MDEETVSAVEYRCETGAGPRTNNAPVVGGEGGVESVKSAADMTEKKFLILSKHTHEDDELTCSKTKKALE